MAALRIPREDVNDLARWVMAVARRRAVDVVRRRVAAARALARMVHHEPATLDPADVVADRAAASWVIARLHELPTVTSEIVRAVANGDTVGQVAVERGMSYRAAESHVTRARRWALRRCAAEA